VAVPTAVPTIRTSVGEQSTSYAEVAESPGVIAKVTNEYPPDIGVFVMLFSILSAKQFAVVGLGVGVAAVLDGAGVAVAAVVAVGNGVPVIVAVGTGVGGGVIIFLPAAATQLPVAGRETVIHVPPPSADV
jgi:hypothetical protein